MLEVGMSSRGKREVSEVTGATTVIQPGQSTYTYSRFDRR